ncbi:hypothetical protein CYMTET_10601 [Cymbomonas tetramitiformis]|uniref:Uncharacterized protein n=1 Tax=Cymbomonas tetramitiformis TaxID=36881 RepID=A0AAE0GNW1_9CHLO|nr:hypothetical protein CYMTET_10601 [Cymbomonas tetramitiformis]
MVSALRTTFVTENIGVAPLFRLEDATLPIRVEANDLVFSTLELLIDPNSSAADWGHSDMLGARIVAGVDPRDAIGDFNAALKAARTRATLLDEDVKALFIKALDSTFYQPVVSRLLLHDQRAAHDLSTIQQWVRECYTAHVKAGTATASAHRYSHGRHFMERGEDISDDPSSELADLRTMVLDLKRQLAALADYDGSPPADRGYTPRAAKAGRQMKFRNGISAYAFAEEAESSVLAARIQQAIDHVDAEEFDALYVLAGGKPDIVADISACSFCEEDGEALVYAIDEYTDLARHVDTGALNINTFTANVRVGGVRTGQALSRRVGGLRGGMDGSTGRWCWTECLDSPNLGDTTASAVRRRTGRHGEWCDASRYTTAETGSASAGEAGISPLGRVVPLPPELQDPDPPIPDSPPYSPPPYTSDDEAEGSTDNFDIGRPSIISSTHDSPPASEAGGGGQFRTPSW